MFLKGFVCLLLVAVQVSCVRCVYRLFIMTNSLVHTQVFLLGLSATLALRDVTSVTHRES